MDLQNEKCVMVIDENLPLGIIANTAAIMGITLGKEMPEVVGANVTDQSGNEHLGIIEFPVPILKGSSEIIKAIREKLYQPDFQDLTVVTLAIWHKAVKPMMNLFQKWETCQKALCNTSVLPSAALRKKSISSQAVCHCCDRLNQQQTAGTWKIPMLQRFVLQFHIHTIPHNSTI